MIKKFIYGLYDFLIPRFTTEYAALYENEDGVLVTTISADQVRDVDPTPDGALKIRSFVWLWFVWSPKAIGDPITWNEYKELP